MCRGCNRTYCITFPTPLNVTKDGVRSFKTFTWVMFSLMAASFLICFPITLCVPYGPIIIPNVGLSIIYLSILTPGPGSMKDMRKYSPDYYRKALVYLGVNWGLGAISILTGLFGAGFYTEDDYYYYYDSGNYYSYNPYEEAGFWLIIASAITNVAEIIMVPCNLYLLFLVKPKKTDVENGEYEDDSLKDSTSTSSSPYNMNMQNKSGMRGGVRQARPNLKYNNTNMDSTINEITKIVQNLATQIQGISNNSTTSRVNYMVQPQPQPQSQPLPQSQPQPQLQIQAQQQPILQMFPQDNH